MQQFQISSNRERPKYVCRAPSSDTGRMHTRNHFNIVSTVSKYVNIYVFEWTDLSYTDDHVTSEHYAMGLCDPGTVMTTPRYTVRESTRIVDYLAKGLC